MSALITGGAGFAGSHLAEYLQAQGQEVVVLAAENEDLKNLENLPRLPSVERGDLRDAARLRELVSRLRPERVYHLAALSSPSESLHNPAITYDVNFNGTLHLLQVCRELGTACRFLCVSSSEVYGHAKEAELPFRESTPLRPVTPYAGSKAAAEMLAYQFSRSYGLPVVRVRPFNHTGPRQSPIFVCSDFARQIAEINLGLRPPSMTVGNIKVSRDFSDVRDIVRGYYLLLEKGTAGEVYQLGSGRATPLEEVLDILLELCCKHVDVTTDPSRLRASETLSLWGDISKTEQSVGWKPQYSLEVTLQDLVEYWLKRLSS